MWLTFYGMNINRKSILATVRRALSETPAVALLGPRQVGKTTLAREIARLTDGAIYLDLERRDDQRRLEDPRAFLEPLGGRLVIIDEVHRSPELFAELRGLIDDRRAAMHRAGQFLLLGSAALDLVQKASETLAGRIAYIDMAPITPTEATASGIDANTLWLRGGFPDSLISKTDETSYEWRQDFIRSYLERDVPMFAPRMPATTIGRLWTMLANGQGSQLNNARLAQGLGVSAPMINRYIDLLVDLMLARRLHPWSGNLNKRLVRSPKVYVRDSGIVHALLEIGTSDQLLGHPIVGPSWEGFILEALIGAAGKNAQPTYYRTADGAELDLVFERGGKPFIGIEIKRSAAPKITPGFSIACDDLSIEHRFVVSSGSDSYRTKAGAEVLPVLNAIAKVQDLLKSPFA
jgi:uncharacterized protein